MIKRISSLIIALMLLLGLGLSLADGEVIGIVENAIENNVNIRSGPGTNYSIIDSAPPMSRYECLGEENGWYIIKLDADRIGYISKRLTRFIENTAPESLDFTVPVYLKTTDGVILQSYNAPITPGSNQISPNQTPPGYKLISAGKVNVFCSSNGKPTPAAVLFLYVRSTSPDEGNGAFLVQYKDLSGNVVASEYINLNQGIQTVYANSAALPSGYRIVGNDKLPVYVDSNMKATPHPIVFLVVADGNNNQNYNLEIQYKSTDGTLLNTERKLLSPGKHTIYANNALVPSNYQLYSQSSVDVTVGQYPIRVTFLYRKIENQGNNLIPVYYKSTKGDNIHSEYVSLNEGINTITAKDQFAPGYRLQSPRTITVRYQNGIASPSSVIFIYKKLVYGKVNVIYKDVSNNIFHTETRSLVEGTHYVSPRASVMPTGYRLTSNPKQKVKIDGEGYASPASVEFVYAPPITATITLHYRDSSGTEHASEQRTVYYGKNVVKANKSYLPSGYKFTGETAFGVDVDINGNPSVSKITIPIGPGSGGGGGGGGGGGSNPPNPPGSPNTLPMHKKARLSGDYIVYTGPGTNYLRAEGKARVINGVCRWYGYDGSFVMMGYENSKGAYRIGYIDAAGTPPGLNLPNLQLANEKVTLLSEARVTDDPIIKVGELFRLPAGTEVTFLGYLPNSRWAYIETEYSGQPVRGFINKAHIGK